jgi:hypothetical protein
MAAFTVPSPVVAAFRLPVSAVRLGRPLPDPAPVAVPKTPMHENHSPVPGQNDVWAAGKVPEMEPKPVALPVKKGTKQPFGLCIAVSDGRHVFGASWRDIPEIPRRDRR